ncbi:hypothetical protein GJAV_G00053940 [Gymnothorax javanicus]|nr:hypothetical protein GJAV_G00053940 [Gymnothorax javanicus]
MSFAALFKFGQKATEKQPAVVSLDQGDDDLDEDLERTGYSHHLYRRGSKHYKSFRRKKDKQLTSKNQPNQSPAPSPRQSRDPNKTQGTSYPVYISRSPLPPHPNHQAFQSGTALPSNGEPTSRYSPQNGAMSPSVTEFKGGSGGPGLSPNDGQHGRTSQGGHFSKTQQHKRSMENLVERMTPWSVQPGKAVADLDAINLRLNNGESSQKQEGQEPVSPSTSQPSTIDVIKNIEVLYQEYRDTSEQKEVQQRRERDGMSTAGGGVTQPALQLQLRNSSQSLWQNLDVVKQSGLLSKLPQREIIMQEAMFELVTSEASYYKSLELLETHFLKNPELGKTLIQSDMHFLFSNIEDVMKASEKFLMDLENRVEQSILISDVCDIVHDHALNHFHVFIKYVTNQAYQERHYRRILEGNTAFREIITQLENRPRVRGLSFTSFLILPFQRITRLKLLVQNILKNAEEHSEREANAVKAHLQLEKIVKQCNEEVRKMNRTEEVISIGTMLEFKCKSVPVISHSRWLLKKGELQHMSGPTSSKTMRTRKLYQPVYLFLFNDLLLITKRSSSEEKHLVLDSCIRNMLRTEDLEDQGQMLANVFRLKLLENQDERQASYMLKASSMSEKLRWMCALTPNRRTRFSSTRAHQPECPQVQCVQSYSSQEADELSIETADILSVLERTDDGWMLGERLHDGEKGWFPFRVVEEIKNEELRAQNLRECQRIQRAQAGGPGANTAGSRARYTAKYSNWSQANPVLEQD